MFDPALQKYVGLPFQDKGREWDGVDCYGLLYLLYREERGIILPRYESEYETIRDHARVTEAFTMCCEDAERWKELPADEPLELYDALVFRVRGRMWHCGIYVAVGFMLHIMEGMNCALERYLSPIWKPRYVNAYRYRG